MERWRHSPSTDSVQGPVCCRASVGEGHGHQLLVPMARGEPSLPTLHLAVGHSGRDPRAVRPTNAFFV